MDEIIETLADVLCAIIVNILTLAVFMYILLK